MTLGSSYKLDDNGRELRYGGWNLSLVSAPTAFLGGTANARGDEAGTSDPLTLFTVTGVVAVTIFGVCTVDLVSAGAGTLSVGTTINTAGLIALTTATAIDADEIWIDATPDSSAELTSSIPEKVITTNIIESVATADITAGNIYYVCSWFPLTPTSKLTSNYPV